VTPFRAGALGLALLVLLCAALLFAWNAGRSPTPWLNHDVAFHSWLGQEMLRGGRLYVDFIDSNPPGSQFLHMGLVAATDLLGAPAFLVHHLFVLALGFGGLLLLLRVFDRDEESTTLALVALAYALLAVRTNFANNLFEGAGGLPYDFGQREHLFALLFLPYLLWRLRGGRPWPLLYPWLVLLGFVALFKPYWPFFLAATELVAWLRERRLERPVIGALGMGMVLPYLLLLVHSPASFAAFFTEILPYQLGGSYSHYGTSYAAFAGSRFHGWMVLASLAFLAVWGACFRRGRVPRPALWLLLALVVASYLSALHQRKFWSYHLTPLFGLVAVGGLFLAARWAGGLGSARSRAVTTLLAVMLVALAGTSLGGLAAMLNGYPPFGHDLVPLIEGRDRVMFVSMSVDYSYAPLYTGVPAVGPWSVHMELPAVLARAGDSTAELTRYAAEISERIGETLPELLVFAPYRQALPRGQTLHGLLRGLGVVPRGDYRRVPDGELEAAHPGLAGWTVYVRLDGS
jgi:hypothetical protein